MTTATVIRTVSAGSTSTSTSSPTSISSPTPTPTATTTTTTTTNTTNTTPTTNTTTTTTTNSASTLPSPISPPATAPVLEHLLLQIALPLPLPQTDRAALLHRHLTCLKLLYEKAQRTHNDIHGAIQQYQQLVLTTHARVASAKNALMLATCTSPQTSFPFPPRGSTTGQQQQPRSNASSRASSPPTTPGAFYPSPRRGLHFPRRARADSDVDAHGIHTSAVASDLDRTNSSSSSNGLTNGYTSNTTTTDDSEDSEMARVQQLRREHADLGRRLSQLLIDKAAAEEAKKRLGDGLNQARARIREIERILAE
ncbi:hypothetical protein BGZ99_010515 [Dissophora globulifera]|uniref:Uncharacterized protein n=1 Tax=Dissophora globulifera TaxID=979702 RepID=A0A9P6ULR6_9FUNG|nr:hypothetical protein BGZ99_010515 [Dissophora globulifera]